MHACASARASGVRRALVGLGAACAGATHARTPHFIRSSPTRPRIFKGCCQQVAEPPPTMLRMRIAGAMPQHAARLRLRMPGSFEHRRAPLHSARACGRGCLVAARMNTEKVVNQQSPKPRSGGLAVGGLPAWIPCSGSITMVAKTVARGVRSGAATSRAVSTEATPAAVKLYLGYAPRVWAMGAGHCAFVMLASMYLMTDMVLLRVLGIIANAFDMLYATAPAVHSDPSRQLSTTWTTLTGVTLCSYCFLVAESPLWLNIGWGACRKCML